MKRKEFIASLLYGAGGLAMLPSLGAAKSAKSQNIKFGVITDVHQDFFPEAEDRLRKFIDDANSSQADFIIQIGDFTYPFAKNNRFMQIWDSFKGPKFHVLGNHDMDENTKATFLDFVNQKNLGAHYAFDQGGFHFIILDNNFIKRDGDFVPYEFGNYYKYSKEEIAHVHPAQIEWLKKDLRNTDKPVIVFSHQPINISVSNGEEILKVFREENALGKKIIATFSGHHHKNWHLEVDGVHHIQVNSASYKWVGKTHPLVHGRYPKEVEEKYPLLPQMAPYDDSLYAIVELDGRNRKMTIEGRTANFIPPSPYELGYYEHNGQMSASSNLDSRLLKF